jgi:hypothetical protein
MGKEGGKMSGSMSAKVNIDKSAGTFPSLFGENEEKDVVVAIFCMPDHFRHTHRQTAHITWADSRPESEPSPSSSGCHDFRMQFSEFPYVCVLVKRRRFPSPET